ncbi:uncharacterized protein LOC115384843 [Salarias fasciatus]|uniref:uncharacterized protein LOC115384843 n=1 Tax=Salarias fasciatus TaxID=181472 RepID=UPI00117666ED|nr:uncharacterized protein LOC115384843 [Salarias fasciatus]
MDFPVEAKVHLNGFRDKHQALGILHSHGFRVKDQGPGWVRVEGAFPQLKDVKAQLEQLVQDHGGQNGPPGTVSSYYGSATRNKSRSAERPDSFHHSQQRSPPRPGPETFIIDSDVFKYANRFRKKEMDDILTHHAAFMTEVESGDSSTITVRGKHPKAAAQNLQDLLGHLGKSLRTQEVPRQDMDRNGDALLEKIRKDDNGFNSVLVCETRDGLHLIGPPRESFDLQQQLMRSAGRRGRSFVRGAASRFRSSSTPETRKDRGRRAADESPPPRGATGYSPPGNQDPPAPRDAWDSPDAWEHGAEPDRRRSGFWRRLSLRKRSRSEVRRKPEKPNGVQPTREESRQPNSSSFFAQLFRNPFKKHKNKKHKK